MIDRDLHGKALWLVQEEIAQLEARLTELRQVARFHQRRQDEVDGVTEPSLAVVSTGLPTGTNFGSTKESAALAVLRIKGVPTGTAEITKALRGNGYGAGLKYKILYNAIFTALSRSKHAAKEGTGRGMKWRLA